jgi:ribosome-binding protein aMBF1 (putative translation factor)
MGLFRRLAGIKDAPKQTAIEAACEAKGITLAVLVKKSKVSQNTVDKYNVMDAKIPTGTKNKLEKVLGKGSLASASK